MARIIIQEELFDDLPPPGAGTGSALVRIGGLERADMSPSQRSFNDLAKKIEALKETLENVRQRYERHLEKWAKTLAARETTLAARIASLAKAIDGKAASFKLGVRQRETVGLLIVAMLENSFNRAPPDEEAQSLYERWSTSLAANDPLDDEEVECFIELARSGLGIELDEDTVRAGKAAIEAAIMKATREDKQADGEGQGSIPRTRRKKTKKQQEREEKARNAEEIKTRSIRSVYISLAKALHPDVEPDKEERERKEKTMKEVTAAYDARNLHELLRIEMEWLATASSHFRALDEDRLSAFIALLKEQARELRGEIAALAYEPRYQPIFDYLTDDPEETDREITRASRDCKKKIEETEELIETVSAANGKKPFMEFIRLFS